MLNFDTMPTTIKKYDGVNTTVVHGNSLEFLPLLPDATIDLVFADPPYNIGKQIGDFKDQWDSMEDYVEWCYQWLDECIRVLKPTGSLYVMTSTQAMPFFDIWLRERIYVKSRIVWHYDSSGVQARKYFGSLYEPILHCTKHRTKFTFNADDIAVEARTGSVRNLVDYRKGVPTPYNTTKVPGNAWYIPRVRYRMPEYEVHPSQKPRSLMERIIKASSNVGDVVLDPFCGTFTTPFVAQQIGRRSIGIELQLKYVKIGLRILGIATHFEGEPLNPPEKTYVRKNGVRHQQSARQRDLFDGTT